MQTLGTIKNKIAYYFDSTYYGTTSYSAGVFHYDTRLKIYYNSFYPVNSKATFLSFENQKTDFYGYTGKKIKRYELYNKFDQNSGEAKERFKQYTFNYFKLSIFILLVLSTLFLMFNYEGILLKNEIKHESSQCSAYTPFVTHKCTYPLDLSKIKSERMTIEGSITSTTHKKVRLVLINTTLKKIVYSDHIDLKDNLVNNASAINTLIKNVDPGKYELAITSDISPSSGETMEIYLDLRFTIGQIVNYTPFIFALFLVVVLLVIMYIRLDVNFSQKGSIKPIKIFSNDKYIFAVALILIVSIYSCYELYTTSYRNTTVQALEDASYIGQSNNHYIHRTYSSHK